MASRQFIYESKIEELRGMNWSPKVRGLSLPEAEALLVAAWLSGNALVSINVVALRRARLVLGWVTVHGYTILVFNQSHPGLLSLAILPWVGTMSTGGGLGHREGRNGEFCVTVALYGLLAY